jgi:dihydropteroate synthase
MIRVVEFSKDNEIRQAMREMKVDEYGIAIMAPKAISHLVRINALSNIAANILKQEMLSLGGDVAVARDALTGKTKKTDCLLMGNLTQFKRLAEKLARQPFGLAEVATGVRGALISYQQETFVMRLGTYTLRLGQRARIMGIVNATPDSFSGDGLYASANRPIEKTIEYVEKMVSDGADIIDIGGESTRPGARAVSSQEEIKRTIPLIKLVTKRLRVPVSIDTSKPEVAHAAVDNGAVIINDITGLRNPRMRAVARRYKTGVIVMHMRGNPRTMQRNPVYGSLVDDIIGYLHHTVEGAVASGIDREKIIIDPGIGFGKTLTHNLQILKRLKEFKVIGRPICIGPSRKSFIGKILNAPLEERLSGTISACVLAVKHGAQIIRVHDCAAVKQALQVSHAIG